MGNANDGSGTFRNPISSMLLMFGFQLKCDSFVGVRFKVLYSFFTLCEQFVRHIRKLSRQDVNERVFLNDFLCRAMLSNVSILFIRNSNLQVYDLHTYIIC